MSDIVFGGEYFDQYASIFDDYSWKIMHFDRIYCRDKIVITKRVQLFSMNCIFSEMCMRPRKSSTRSTTDNVR